MTIDEPTESEKTAEFFKECEKFWIKFCHDFPRFCYHVFKRPGETEKRYKRKNSRSKKVFRKCINCGGLEELKDR